MSDRSRHETEDDLFIINKIKGYAYKEHELPEPAREKGCFFYNKK